MPPGQIERVEGDGDLMALSDRLARRLQRLLAARRKMEIAALGGERLRDGEADAFRGTGDQRRLAVQIEIHAAPSSAGSLPPQAVWRKRSAA